jgi:hypothetical protein
MDELRKAGKQIKTTIMLKTKNTMYTENEFRDRFWNLDPLEIIANGSHEFMEETKIRLLIEQGDYSNYQVALFDTPWIDDEDIPDSDKKLIEAKIQELKGDDLYYFFENYIESWIIIEEYISYPVEEWPEIELVFKTHYNLE